MSNDLTGAAGGGAVRLVGVSDEPAQTQESVRRSYDTVAADYARMMPDTGREHRPDLAVLDAFIQLVGPRPVLDAGCGAGRIARYLADRGVPVQGVDLSPRMIAQGRAQHPDLDLSVASITDLPHADQSFAGVVLWYSTIHLSAPELTRALEESLRVLVPEGHLLIAFQSGVGTRTLFDGYPGADVTLERYLRTADEVADQLLARGTTEVLRVERHGGGGDADDHAMLIHQKADPGTG